MSTKLTEADVKVSVSTGTDSFTRVFDCLRLDVTAVNRASWHFRFQLRGKRMQMKIGVYTKDAGGNMPARDVALSREELEILC